jgi:hypothetical protein
MNNNHHLHFINNAYTQAGLKHKLLTMSYADGDHDKYLIKYFNIDALKLPKVIAYDFDNKKYFVANLTTFKEDEIENILNNIEINKVDWTSGSKILDFILSIGFNSASLKYILYALIFLMTAHIVISKIIRKNKDNFSYNKNKK